MTRSEAIESLKLDGITFGGNSRRLAQFFEALDMAVESLGSKWIPCDERLPDENGRYLATGTKANPIAWMPFPEAYKGE